MAGIIGLHDSIMNREYVVGLGFIHNNNAQCSVYIDTRYCHNNNSASECDIVIIV